MRSVKFRRNEGVDIIKSDLISSSSGGKDIVPISKMSEVIPEKKLIN